VGAKSLYRKVDANSALFSNQSKCWQSSAPRGIAHFGAQMDSALINKQSAIFSAHSYLPGAKLFAANFCKKWKKCRKSLHFKFRVS
jgi:hypothetical protein